MRIRNFGFTPVSLCSIEEPFDATGGAANPPADSGNAGGGDGNSSAAAGGDSGSNNNGQGFDPATFWQGPDQGANGAPSGESAAGGNSDSGTGGSGGDLQTALTTQLQSLNFGGPLFDAGIAEQINSGNFDGIHERFNGALQTAVRQSLAMNVQILRPFAEQLMSQMREEFSGTLNGRDNNEALIRDFPSAKDPRVAPVVQQIFGQALKNTKGNRELAVTQTKDMLRLMAGTTAPDLGFELASPGSSDSGGQRGNKATNWLDELTGR